jgi:hypothetical protein
MHDRLSDGRMSKLMKLSFARADAKLGGKMTPMFGEWARDGRGEVEGGES